MHHGTGLTRITRAEVESWWRAVICGEVSREAAHAWAVPIVEVGWIRQEAMAMSGAQYLHGLDMTRDPAGNPGRIRHGMEPGRVYVRSDAQVVELLEYWLADCTSFDREPAEHRRRKGIATVKALLVERPDKARPMADTLVRHGVITAEDAERALAGEPDLP